MVCIKRCSRPFFLFVCFFLFGLNVEAGSASISLGGSNSVYVGKNVEVTIALNNINSQYGIMGVQLKMDYDASSLEFVSASNMAPFMVSYEDKVKTVAGISFTSGSDIKSASANIMKLTFKTKKEGSAFVKVTQVEVTERNNEIARVATTSKTISILPPPSTNTFLASLSVSSGSLTFDKNVKNYNVEVGETVTSMNIDARAEDSGAKVTGTGGKSLNYGKNMFNIVVTAPSGDTATYVVNVTRIDNRSSNANLATLNIEGVTLNPGFNPGTINYTAKVPFEVENLKVSATAEDSKSKVVISGQNNLEAEKVRNVTIKVTAENGGVKTYTVKVTRGRDPNKPKSNNNYLASLKPNVGVLSPAFNRDVSEYSILVPVETTLIELNAVAEDEVFAEVNMDGPEKLTIGENRYTFLITAEDGSTKEYTVLVTREGSKVASESTLLKELHIENGTLDREFDKNVFVYRFKKGKGDFKIEGIPEDENNRVTYTEEDGVIVIVVIDGVGNSSVYTFIQGEKGNGVLNVVLGIVALGLIGAGPFVGYKYAIKKGLTKKLDDKRIILNS